MKLRFLSILCLLMLACGLAQGAVIVATVTITNTPVNGDTFIVNANTRTWTNTASTPAASWITIASGIGPTTTNLYNHIAAHPYLSPFLILGRSSTNIITLTAAGALSITTNSWMTVSYSINAGTNVMAIAGPPYNVPGDTNRTNFAHWIVDYLNGFVRTNSVNTNAVSLSNYLSKGASPQQYVAAPVQFNGVLRSAAELAATNGFTKALTNIDMVSSNGVNYGSAFRSEGSGGNSLQLGSNALSSGSQSAAIGNNAASAGSVSIAIGQGAAATNTGASAVGNAAVASGSFATAVGYTSEAIGTLGATAIGANSAARYFATAIGASAGAYGSNSVALGAAAQTGSNSYGATALGVSAVATQMFSVALGPLANTPYSNSVAIGANSATTDTNQIRLGTSSEKVSIPGQLLISGTQSNTVFKGTNIAGGAWAYPRFDLSSIANGNNIAIPIGTNRFVRLSGAVSASPTLCGFVGGATTGGIDGQDVIVHNDLGYALTLAQNTVDPVPANRIETYDGNDVAVAVNGWFAMSYSGSDARWHILWPFPSSTSGTNSTLSIWTNGVAVDNLATNLDFTNGIAAVLSGHRVLIGATGGSGATNGLAVIAVNNGQFSVMAVTNTLTVSNIVATAGISAIGDITSLGNLGVRGWIQVSAGFSNRVSYLTDAGSGAVSLWGTNQWWRDWCTSNQTVSIGDTLLSNVIYRVELTNDSSTITWPGTWRWKDGIGGDLANAPSLKGGSYAFNVQLTPSGTNAWVMEGPTVNTVPGLNAGRGTNSSGTITTNFVQQVMTNLVSLNFDTLTMLIPTNNAASNITVNMSYTNTVELWATNNLTFTNWTGVPDYGSSSLLVLIRPQLITRGVNWGNLGLSNPGYSVAIGTNANNLLWTSLTNGKTYALTIARVRTNLFPTLTLQE